MKSINFRKFGISIDIELHQLTSNWGGGGYRSKRKRERYFEKIVFPPPAQSSRPDVKNSAQRLPPFVG